MKRVYIYCGVSGAGKSTFINKAHQGAAVCSADKFFIDADTDEYKFDPSKLGEAHNWCLRNYVFLLELGKDRRVAYVPYTEIVVDNTNTTIAELAPYASLALAYGYELTIRTLWCDPEVAHARNIHGVPLSAVHAMHERLKTRQLPPWWPHSDMPQMQTETA